MNFYTSLLSTDLHYGRKDFKMHVESSVKDTPLLGSLIPDMLSCLKLSHLTGVWEARSSMFEMQTNLHLQCSLVPQLPLEQGSGGSVGWDGVRWGKEGLLSMLQGRNFHPPRISTAGYILSPSKETHQKLIFYSNYTAMLKSPKNSSSRSASEPVAHSFENPQCWRIFLLQGGSEFGQELKVVLSQVWWIRQVSFEQQWGSDIK